MRRCLPSGSSVNDDARVLLLGLGNALLSDDAAGIHAVRLVHAEAAADGIEVAEAETRRVRALGPARGV